MAWQTLCVTGSLKLTLVTLVAGTPVMSRTEKDVWREPLPPEKDANGDLILEKDCDGDAS